jgi:hypothetical protein
MNDRKKAATGGWPALNELTRAEKMSRCTCRKADTISKLRTLSDDERLTSPKRWGAFVSEYEELQTATQIEKYIFTNRLKASLFKKMSDLH